MNAMLHACTGVGGFAIRQPLAAMAAPPRRLAEAAASVFAHNSLLAAAAPTLILIDQARRTPHGDVEHAHGAISAALHAFLATLTDSGETASCIQCAAYGLAATAERPFENAQGCTIRRSMRLPSATWIMASETSRRTS